MDKITIETYHKRLSTELKTSLEMFQKKFISFLDETYDECELNKDNKENICEIILSLMFGEYLISNHEVKNLTKLNNTKNKNLIKLYLLNNTDFYNSCIFLYKIMQNISDFLSELSISLYEKQNDDFNNIFKNTSEEIKKYSSEYNRFVRIVDCYSSESMSISTKAHLNKLETYNLKELLGNEPITYFKQDSLRKYYFTNVYILKNNVKIFNKENMLFGEINQIMKQYEEVIEYILMNFVCVYSVLYNV